MERVDAAGRFGQQLRLVRLARGMTQEQLGMLTDMNPSNIGKIERGTANPSLWTMERIARALGVDVADLLKPSEPGSE